MADDHGPKIAPRRRNQQSHQNAECAGDRDAEWILVSMRCPEQRTLRDTSAYPMRRDSHQTTSLSLASKIHET